MVFFFSVDSFICVVAVVDKGEERKFGSGRREKGRRKGVKKERRNGRMERDWILYHYYLLLLLLYTIADTTVYLLLATTTTTCTLLIRDTRIFALDIKWDMGYGIYIIYSSRWSSIIIIINLLA